MNFQTQLSLNEINNREQGSVQKKRRSPNISRKIALSSLLKLSFLSALWVNLGVVLPVLASEREDIDLNEISTDTIEKNNELDQVTSISQLQDIDSNNEILEESTLSDRLEQITSVSSLRDVSPGDWAFEALRNLVERYGCIAGYPDGTFRGDRALTRYEFAAGLNACLQQIERLASGIPGEDLETIKRLMGEFETELAELGARVDNLEGRVAFLEDHQFSTTTKLSGNAIFSLADLFGADNDKNQTIFQQRVNLSFHTSFSGRDMLFVSMLAGNVPAFPLGGFALPTTTTGGTPVTSAEGTLGVAFGGNTNNDLLILGLGYLFPIGEKSQGFLIGANTNLSALIPTLNPLLDDRATGTGALSLFGQYNSIYALGLTGAGAGINWKLNDQFLLTGAYVADGFGANNPESGSGFFNGGYSAFGQLTWTPSHKFGVAATYHNTYFTSGRFGFNYNGLPLMGTAVANTLAGQTRLAPGLFFDPSPVITNSYGLQAFYQISPKFVISGWFGASYARLIGEGDGTILNYALTFGFPDLGKERNLLGFVIGAEPYLTDFDGGNPQDFKTDIPLHLEAFYRYQVTDNISITPGFIVLTAPNQDASNGVDVIANIRTTFTF
jgi:hypothetical protein